MRGEGGRYCGGLAEKLGIPPQRQPRPGIRSSALSLSGTLAIAHVEVVWMLHYPLHRTVKLNSHSST
ncbi:hypothetical protein KC352_g18 [Hortaea werneckii]|nr:hypothetical protein KC352_g18 [Hortaea werneckii]